MELRIADSRSRSLKQCFAFQSAICIPQSSGYCHAGAACDRITPLCFFIGLAFRVIHTVHLRQIFGRLSRHFAPRKIAAAAMALSLLTTFAPFSIYSSSHSCSMPCCASGSCVTGACDVSIDKAAPKSAAESHCEQGEDAMHGMPSAAGMTVRVESFIDQDLTDNKQDLTELCGVEKPGKTATPLLHQPASFHETNIRSQSFTRPCGPECCGAGVGAFSQSRRSRELALLGHQSRPRPPTARSVSDQDSHPLFLQAQWRRQSTPRAPPFNFPHA